MKRTLLLAAVLLAALPATAPAITTNGTFDGNAHPNVGALGVKRADGSFAAFCSGTLVRATVFLTASHCTTGEDRVYVTFDPTDVEPSPDGLLAGRAVTNPAYDPKQVYQHDVSIVRLDAPVGIRPARLPAADLLGRVRAAGTLRDARFTNVGYGTQEKVNGPGGPTFPFLGDRFNSVSSFKALDPRSVHAGQNQANGDGGTCYGDSGGPQFLGAGAAETDVVVSVTSTGDVPCYATSVNTRTDTPAARAFLAAQGVPLP
jgi:secreted trypsin-like serine protease